MPIDKCKRSKLNTGKKTEVYCYRLSMQSSVLKVCRSINSPKFISVFIRQLTKITVGKKKKKKREG